MLIRKDIPLIDKEKCLLKRSQDGDPKAFSELIKKYENKIYALMHHSCAGIGSDIEDIFQETFIKAFENIKKFRGDSSFGTWLYRIALNQCWQRLRKKERTPVVPLLDRSSAGGIHADPVDLKSLPDEIFEKKEIKDIIHAALNELPETYRIVLMLRDIQGLSNEETAKITGETIASIKSRIHRGRLYLRDKLMRYFSGRKKHPWIAKS